MKKGTLTWVGLQDLGSSRECIMQEHVGRFCEIKTLIILCTAKYKDGMIHFLYVVYVELQLQ